LERVGIAPANDEIKLRYETIFHPIPNEKLISAVAPKRSDLDVNKILVIDQNVQLDK